MKRLFLMLSFVLSLGILWAQGNQRKCAFPMDDYHFRMAMADFAHQNDNPRRDRAIRTFTAANCLNTLQTRRMAALYSNEYNRFDYVIYAADFVIDYNNYGSMTQLFRNPALQQELLAHLGYEPAMPICNIPGYTGRIAGPRFASDIEFNSVFNVMQHENFDNNRFEAFRAAAGNRLFTAAHLRALSEIFDFDSHRMKFAKAALAYCYDLDNFYTLGSTFTFDSYRRELNRYFRSNVDRYIWDGTGFGHYNILQNQNYYVLGYTGTLGNFLPICQNEFNTLLEMLGNEQFDVQRHDKIQNAVGNRGLTAEQISRLAELFDFDNKRYDFATWAYSRVYDVDNFYTIASVFEFENYKRELLNLIS